jgi:hypothetical protein
MPSADSLATLAFFPANQPPCLLGAVLWPQVGNSIGTGARGGAVRADHNWVNRLGNGVPVALFLFNWKTITKMFSSNRTAQKRQSLVRGPALYCDFCGFNFFPTFSRLCR